MYTIGVRAARADLAAIVRRAHEGESTLITDRGEPVAVLGPVDQVAPPLAQLISSGQVLAPRRTGEWRCPAPTTMWAGSRIDLALRDLRG